MKRLSTYIFKRGKILVDQLVFDQLSVRRYITFLLNRSLTAAGARAPRGLTITDARHVCRHRDTV